LAWIADVPHRQPLHLFVNYYDPHWPYEPPAGYDDLPAARRPLTMPEIDPQRGATLTPEQRSAYLDRYDGEIRFMDHHLGRLLDGLRAAGRYDNALILITADHGELFGEHAGAIGHGTWLYEGVLHVPLLVHLPGSRGAGAVVDAPVSLVDVLPMIAGELRLSVPRGVQGVPFGQRSVIFAEETRHPTLLKLFGPSVDRDLVTAVSWPWKLIVPSVGPTELYRLDQDPNESVPMSNPAMETKLLHALEVTRAALPPANPVPRRASAAAVEHLRALGYVQ